MKAVIELDVPEWQIGQDVSVYFPDTMLKHGKCALLKEQGEQIKNRDESLEKAREEIKWLRGMMKEQEAVKPTINEDGEAYCVCGENVGIIPNNKNLPSVRIKYCPECGRKVKWNA